MIVGIHFGQSHIMNCLSESLQENTRELTIHSSHSRLECHLPGNWSLLHWSTSQVYQGNNMSVSQLAFFQIRAYSSILCSFQVSSGIQLYQASLSEDTVPVQIWNTVKQVCWLNVTKRQILVTYTYMYLCNRPPCTLHTFGQSPFALGSTFFFPPPKSGLSCSNLACLLTRACWSNTQNSPILILEVHFFS